MDEKNRNSMKLDIEAVRLSENDRDQPTETYKQILEFNLNNKCAGELNIFHPKTSYLKAKYFVCQLNRNFFICLNETCKFVIICFDLNHA